MDAWLDGTGCVPLNNLMEDAATAEICRSQLWAWLKYQRQVCDGERATITTDMYISVADTVSLRNRDSVMEIFMDTMNDTTSLRPFLTTDGYPYLQTKKNVDVLTSKERG